MGATDERLLEAETKLSYLEDALETLNDVVIEQRALIDALNRRCDRLAAEIEAADAGAAGDERPPHY